MSETPCYKPLYTTVDSVKVRLSGKVAFEQGTTTPERNSRVMPIELVCQFISDAETAVEQDLRRRYAIPFRSKRTDKWADLPDHTRRAIRSIVDLKAVRMILADSFGSGTHITGDGYIKRADDDYELLLRRLLGQDLEGSEYGEKRFRMTPPLEDLRLAATNAADSGFVGSPLDANPNSYGPYDTGGYAAEQVNDPSKNLNWFGLGGRRGPR